MAMLLMINLIFIIIDIANIILLKLKAKIWTNIKNHFNI